MTAAYLYKWTQLSTNKWYVGSRTAKNCHPNDGYICSSKKVKPLINENSNEWIREVLAIGDPLYIVDLERRYLTTLNAKEDPLSYNEHNGDGIFSQAGKPSWNKGKTGVQANTRKGQKHTKEAREKMSANMKGRIPWNKGSKGMQVAWNKGYKETRPDVIERIIAAAQIRPISQNSIDALVKSAKDRIGQPSPMKGKKQPKGHSEKVSAYQRGRKKEKVVCRIHDKKEMAMAHYVQWLNKLKN